MALEHVDPAAGLSTEELQRAIAMKAFVAGQVESLSLAGLARRCRVAASFGDRAAMYALAHDAARRADDDITGEIRDAVAELRRALDPEAETRLAAAREIVEEAQALRERAYLARRGAQSVGDLYVRQTYGDIGQGN